MWPRTVALVGRKGRSGFRELAQALGTLNLKMNLATTLTQEVDLGMSIPLTEFRFHTLKAVTV